jgi:hypothetical protein
MADRISQEVIEVALDSGANIRITQIALEVILCSGSPPSVACPVGGNTATVGVPYSAQVVATGGTPPYTFRLLP